MDESRWLPDRAGREVAARIDVVVCAHNEVEQLDALFRSFRDQTARRGFRVVFVDNASTDGTAAALPELSRGVPLTPLSEPRRGKSEALNTGVAATDTEHVAFIDADCQASPDWVERILTVLAATDADILGGPYYPVYRSPRPRWFRDEYNTFAPFGTRQYLEEGYLCGSNLIVRRALLDSVGGFATRFQISGRGYGGGEDTELQIRARATRRGLTVVYDPSIIVRHLTRPTHMKVIWHCRRRFQYGRYFARLWGRFAGRRAALKSLGVSLGRVFWMLTGGLLFRDRRRYPYPQNLVFEGVADELFTAGLALGFLRRE